MPLLPADCKVPVLSKARKAYIRLLARYAGVPARSLVTCRRTEVQRLGSLPLQKVTPPCPHLLLLACAYTHAAWIRYKWIHCRTAPPLQAQTPLPFPTIPSTRLPPWAPFASTGAPASGLPAAAFTQQPASPYAPLLADALSACGGLQPHAAALADPEAWHSGINGNGAHKSAFGYSHAQAAEGQGGQVQGRDDLQQAGAAWQRPPPSSPISAAVYGLGRGSSSSGVPGDGVQGVGLGLPVAAAVGGGGEGGGKGTTAGGSPQPSALRQVLLLQLQELQRETEQMKRRLMVEG